MKDDEQTMMPAMVLAHLIIENGGQMDLDAKAVMNNLKNCDYQGFRITIIGDVLRLELEDES